MNTPPNSAINRNVSLISDNTFNLDVTATYKTEISHPDDLLRLMDSEVFNNHSRYVLGGGSNVLFPEDYHGLIIKISIPGITVLSEDSRTVVIRVGAGVVWDELVSHCLKMEWGGLENLSMIPGLTGAAPIQNIGAYGVELKSSFVSLDAIQLTTGRTEQFDKKMCRFGYRDSIFKSSLKGQYLITAVTLRLDKTAKLHLSYGNLREVLSYEGIEQPTIHDVSRVVRRIRSSKLPDPAVIGNAGSFFKNPVIKRNQYELLQEKAPEVPGFDLGNDRVKVPAAWLIEQCGFKGKRDGDAGVHEQHALILVNYGKASGRQLLRLAYSIQQNVSEKFGIILQPEVNIVSDSDHYRELLLKPDPPEQTS